MEMFQAIAGRLGRCSRCMRQAFAAAAASLGAGVVSWVWFGASTPTAITCLVAAGLACLWVGHLIAYSSRASARTRASEDAVRDPSRRALFPTFAKTFAAVAVATAAPRLALARGVGEECSKNCLDEASSCRGECQDHYGNDQTAYYACTKQCNDQFNICFRNCPR